MLDIEEWQPHNQLNLIKNNSKNIVLLSHEEELIHLFREMLFLQLVLSTITMRKMRKMRKMRIPISPCLAMNTNQNNILGLFDMGIICNYPEKGLSVPSF
jgi:hypothetical protein